MKKADLWFIAAIFPAYCFGVIMGLWLFGTRTPDPDVVKLTNERDSLLNESIQWQIDYAACAKARYENRAMNELPLRK